MLGVREVFIECNEVLVTAERYKCNFPCQSGQESPVLAEKSRPLAGCEPHFGDNKSWLARAGVGETICKRSVRVSRNELVKHELRAAHVPG